MDHFERVFAALAGEPVDRVPIALWRHHPDGDATAAQLRDSSLGWQRKYDWDLLKITPGAGYSYEPYGTAFVYPGKDPYRVDRGIRECIEESRLVKTTGDWSRIRPLDVRQDPVLEQLIAATAQVAHAVGGTVPTLQTVMSPAYTVMNLAGRDRFLADIRSDPGRVQPALETVTEVTIDLCHAFLDSGVHGLFYSTLLAASAYLTPDEYRDLCVPLDLQILEAMRARTKLLVHHIHGSGIYFDLLADYPVDAVNWEDRTTPPTLREGRERSGMCVIGGIGEAALLGSADAVRSEIALAIGDTGGRRMILGTGCVTPVIVPEVNLVAARQAVDDAIESA